MAIVSFSFTIIFLIFFFLLLIFFRHFMISVSSIFSYYISFSSNSSLYFFFIQVLHIIRKKCTVTRHYIFWCAREPTSENLSKSQLDREILNWNIILTIVRLRGNFCWLMKHIKTNVKIKKKKFIN